MAIKKVKLKNMSGDQLIPDVGIPSQAGNNGKVLGTNGSSLQFVDMPTVTSTYTATGTDAVNGVAVSNAIAVKQDTLVSGTNIKTVNGTSLLGSGNITIETSSTPNVDGTTVSYNSNDALQTIAVKNVRDNSVLPIWHGTEQQWNQGGSSTWYYWQTSVTAAWTASTLPSSAAWQSVTYGNGKFVVIVNDSNKSAYSTDGINWTASTLPKYIEWYSVTYGDDKFVAVANSMSEAAYSTDGINWTSSKLPGLASWYSVTYGDDKFVAVANNNNAAYSTDGINWTASTLPSSANWRSVTYGDGKFVVVAYGSNKAAYSTDGINWTASTMPSSADWLSVTYGDGKFVVVATDSNVSAVFNLPYDKCYTDTANPTTSSTVYSEPETASGSTISSVTSGAITLSNNNTYYYNQSGNQYTYDTIGNTHPEYLCFIDGVGVKMGNTLIAGNTPITTSITSTSTDAEVPSAKAVYDEVGEVESALNTINSGS